MANLTARKNLAELIKSANASHEGGLKRSLGAVNLILLGIGAIIGAGIFVLTGEVASQYAGPAITISFVIAAFAIFGYLNNRRKNAELMAANREISRQSIKSINGAIFN